MLVERKMCTACGIRGWAGDDIYEDGVFNYNGKIMIELRVLYQLRTAFRAGTAVFTWWGNFLARRSTDLDWLEQNPHLSPL